MLFAPLATIVALAASVSAQNYALTGFGVGTTGGGSAASTTVTSCSALKTAAGSSNAAVIIVSGVLSGCGAITVKGNKTIQGSGSSSGLTGGGLSIKSVSNVIVRNLNFGVPASGGDVIALQKATYVWIDRNTFKSAGLTGDKDGFDGQLDITHACDYVTVSWNKFLDHWKASLVGHSDDNSSEDTGHLRVTYHHNLWSNINSRAPSFRFGTGHIYNSVFVNIPTSGINSRMGAQVVVENSVFRNVKLGLVTNLDSDVAGYLRSTGNVLTNTTTSITQTATWKPSYSYSLDATSNLESTLNSYAGAGH